MAGTTDLSIKYGKMTPRQKSAIYDELADKAWIKEWGERLPRPESYAWFNGVDSEDIKKIQEELLDFLTRIGVKWRAVTREMDDFEAGWWEADKAFHGYNPFETFEP